MSHEPLATAAVEGPTRFSSGGVELIPRGIVLSNSGDTAVAARIGVYGSSDGVTDIGVPFQWMFTAGGQLFRLEDWAPNPDQPTGEYAGGPLPLKLIISWFGDAPRDAPPQHVWEIVATHRALPISPPCGFTVTAATAGGQFDTEGTITITLDSGRPNELTVPYETEFMARGIRWSVDGWTVTDPATGHDGPLMRIRRVGGESS